jgi:hypothetical protein
MLDFVPGRRAPVTAGSCTLLARMASRDSVLFCPFCGDGFEGLSHCPDHELPLVPWQQLPRAKRSDPPDIDLAWHSPRLGRGWLASDALLTWIAFASLPLGHALGSASMGGTMLQLALHGAHKLWLVPAASTTLLLMLRRRRSPQALRAARIAALFTVLIAPLCVLWTWYGVREAVAVLAQRNGQALVPVLGSGAYLVLLATLPGLLGALRLGGPHPP